MRLRSPIGNTSVLRQLCTTANTAKCVQGTRAGVEGSYLLGHAAGPNPSLLKLVCGFDNSEEICEVLIAFFGFAIAPQLERFLLRCHGGGYALSLPPTVAQPWQLTAFTVGVSAAPDSKPAFLQTPSAIYPLLSALPLALAVTPHKRSLCASSLARPSSRPLPSSPVFGQESNRGRPPSNPHRLPLPPLLGSCRAVAAATSEL